MIETDSYPIDFLKCITTQNDLFNLKNHYHIPDDVYLIIPKKVMSLVDLSEAT